MNVVNQVIIIFAGVKGYMDEVTVQQVSDYENNLIESLEATNPAMLEKINSSGKIEGDTETELQKALSDFNKTFLSIK